MELDTEPGRFCGRKQTPALVDGKHSLLAKNVAELCYTLGPESRYGLFYQQGDKIITGVFELC